MAERFDFNAPEFSDFLRDCTDVGEDNVDQYFKENEDPQSTSSFRNHRALHSTPNNTNRPYSCSVVSRSGRRCQTFRESSYFREKASFKKKLSYLQENDSVSKFKARPANVVKKEAFWPLRQTRYLKIDKAPSFKTEQRAEHWRSLNEKKKKMEEMFELEKIKVQKEDEEELKAYRKTLEFKATGVKKL